MRKLQEVLLVLLLRPHLAAGFILLAGLAWTALLIYIVLSKP